MRNIKILNDKDVKALLFFFLGTLLILGINSFVYPILEIGGDILTALALLMLGYMVYAVVGKNREFKIS